VSRGKGRRSIQLVATAIKILEEIQPASVRAVCYRLFVAGLIPDMSKTSTNAVSRALRIAREEGDLEWGWIVDESREAEHVPAWSGPDALIRAAVAQYRKDYWRDQPVHIEVWSEKGTVRGTLGPVLDEYGVTFRVMHGYASATVINELAVLSGSIDKHFIALYVGDWDPSGLHMSDVDLPRRLTDYGAKIWVNRIALRRDDLTDLPSFAPASKRSDSRYRWFVSKVRTRCHELDAMPPPQLRSRLEEQILRLINVPAWEHSIEIERAEVESMQAFHKSWQASICDRGSIS
jgi:hypothetical protein